MRSAGDPDIADATRGDGEGNAASTSLRLAAKIALNGGLIALIGTGAVLAVWPRADAPLPIVQEAVEAAVREEPNGPVAPPPVPAEAGAAPSIAPAPRPRNVALPRAVKPVLCFGFVRDEAGRPIAGATITAHPGDEPRRRSGGDGEPVASAMSDGRGAYRLSGDVSLDGLHVVVQAPAKCRVCQSITPGRRRDFTLGAPGSLEVTMRYAGSGRPVVGQSVLITRSRHRTRVDHRHLNTDENGRIRLEDLAPGTYHVQKLFPPRDADSSAGAVVEAGRTVEVVFEEPGVQWGTVRGIVTDAATVALERKTGTRYEAAPIEVQLTRGGSLHATVRDAVREPVSRASVSLLALRQDGPGQRMSADRKTGMAMGASVSSARGVVTFDRVVPGPYAVVVSVDGFSTQVHEIGRIEDGERTSVVVELRAAELSGIVVDRVGEPVPGVFITPDDQRDCNVVTAWDGTFHLADLAAGPFELRARHGDYDEARITVTERTEAVRIVLQPAATIEGVVLIAGSRTPVRCFSVGYSTAGKGRPAAVTQRDRQGRFRLRPEYGGLRPGSYELEAHAKVEGVEWRGLTTAIVKPGSTTNVEILVHRTVATCGRVVSPDGVPVKDVTVEVFPAADTNRGPIADVRTDEHGCYEVCGLEPADYLVRARHPQWVEVSRTESIHGGHRLVDLVLGRHGAVLHITVHDDAKKPVPNARIDIYRADGSYVPPDRDKYERDYFARKRADPDLTYEAAHRACTVTDATGHLTRRFLPAGRYRITAETDTHRAEAQVTLRPEGPAKITITLPR